MSREDDGTVDERDALLTLAPSQVLETCLRELGRLDAEWRRRVLRALWVLLGPEDLS